MGFPPVTVAAPDRKLPVVDAYMPCDAHGCCDEVPAFCKVSVPAFADACSLESIASKCSYSCGKCHAPAEVLKPQCEDKMPYCPRVAQAAGDSFCDLDINRENCRSTCGLCGRSACEDRRSQRVMCAAAKKNLRRCALPFVKNNCQETCGKCSDTPLKEILERQKCEDPPECGMNGEQASDAAVARYRSCTDFDGLCGFNSVHPDREALCSDPSYRDVLCRATCQTCDPARDVVAEKSPPATAASVPAKLLWRTEKCTDVHARTCPRKCGVCKPRGRRSDWNVDDLKRLAPMLPPIVAPPSPPSSVVAPQSLRVH